ncbi:hypothetical protein FIBSPDRAFT_890850 [Athelia psychrophila]|uniref:Uncharacterized protein n=1 Tax=Athelia psychrophila TaxID=1759441 RepID=A0A166KF36_9AGAM|nr:hypothetical protein FIBSPDRAFT_890850 [Fibularhizoctonia sp. CBS 109695]
MIAKILSMRSQFLPHVPADHHVTADDIDAFHRVQGKIPNYPVHADVYSTFTAEEQRRRLQQQPTGYILPGGGEDIDNIGANPSVYDHLEKRSGQILMLPAGEKLRHTGAPPCTHADQSGMHNQRT